MAKNWRILCIDDEPDILEILSVALGMKHEVVTAGDGLEAIGMLDFCDADFILCDVRMPHMDGFQTVEAIRRHPDYVTTPVFYLTAETSAEMARRGFASGANLYLTKPFDPMRVLSNIDYFLAESGQQQREKRMSPEEVIRKAQEPPAPRAAPVASRPAKTAQAPAAKPEVIETGRARVIVVCADEGQMSRACRGLEAGYECLPCADPLASLQQMFRYEPDILIINPAIPKLSAVGLAQMIRRNPKLRGLVILLMDDVKKPLDQRVVPSMTNQPVLKAYASPAEVAMAVERVTADPEFRPRPKHASIRDLLADEERMRRSLQEEDRRQQRQDMQVREKYRRIQTFIDRNMR